MSIKICPRCGYSLAKGHTGHYAKIYERVRKDGTGPARYVWKLVHTRCETREVASEHVAVDCTLWPH
jgi:hypothetical protein